MRRPLAPRALPPLPLVPLALPVLRPPLRDSLEPGPVNPLVASLPVNPEPLRVEPGLVTSTRKIGAAGSLRIGTTTSPRATGRLSSKIVS